MKKLIVISLIPLWFLLLILLPTLFITSRPSISHQSHPSFFNSLDIVHTYSFDAVTTNANLDSLTFTLKNPQILNNNLIHFKISSGTDEKVLSFSGSNIGDPSNLVLKYKPLPTKNEGIVQINISTDNPDPNSLYLLTDNHGQPVFNSTYYQSGFANRLKFNFHRLTSQLTQISFIYKTTYLLLLFTLFLFL